MLYACFGLYLSIISCGDVIDQPLILFDKYVFVNTPSSSVKFTQIFAKYVDNVVTITAHPIGGSSESVSIQFLYTGSDHVIIDTGSEDREEGNYLAYISDLIAFETGEGNKIELKITEFDELKKSIKGSFMGELGETDNPANKLEIIKSEFSLQYSN